MLRLYQAEWCPWCHIAREALTERGLAYEAVNVPARRSLRDDVRRVSGQELVPVLVDGDRVVVDSKAIVEYLEATYPAAADREHHRALAGFRLVKLVESGIEETVDKLTELLAEREIDVLVRLEGSDISTHLPDDYVLLEAALRSAAAKIVEADATLPLAVLIPLAVFHTEEGTAVAVSKPSASVWLSEDPALIDLATGLTDLLTEAIVAL
jgi:mycoredoxin